MAFFKKETDGEKGLKKIDDNMDAFERLAEGLVEGSELVTTQQNENEGEIARLGLENKKLEAAGKQANTLATNLKAMTEGKLLVESTEDDEV